MQPQDTAHTPDPMWSAGGTVRRVTTLTVALAALVFLVGSGLYISYENVHQFVLSHGKDGFHAELAALGVDIMTLSGLFVSLIYREPWARAAFVIGLLGTGVANALTGWEASAYFGVAVALWPLMSMELSYRIALSLVIPNISSASKAASAPLPGFSKPLQEVSSPISMEQMTIPELSRVLEEMPGDLPSRQRVIQEFGATEWVARQALAQARKARSRE